jgi:hypothetical protein
VVFGEDERAISGACVVHEESPVALILWMKGEPEQSRSPPETILSFLFVLRACAPSQNPYLPREGRIRHLNVLARLRTGGVHSEFRGWRAAPRPGTCAISACEPRQGRKAAALSSH